MKDVDYASGKAPPDYRCASCGAHGVKLWRISGTSRLLCVACVEDAAGERLDTGRGVVCQIGPYAPALPDERGAGFWGCETAPLAAVAWWKALPMALPARKLGPPHGPVEVIKPSSFSPSGRPLSEPVEVNVSGLRGTPAQVAEELRRLAAQAEHGERFASSCCGCKVSVGAPPRSGHGST